MWCYRCMLRISLIYHTLERIGKTNTRNLITVKNMKARYFGRMTGNLKAELAQVDKEYRD